jgi:hypothetical protein
LINLVKAARINTRTWHEFLDNFVDDTDLVLRHQGEIAAVAMECSRTLKYECVFLHASETGSEARAGVGKWIDFYNPPDRTRPLEADH